MNPRSDFSRKALYATRRFGTRFLLPFVLLAQPLLCVFDCIGQQPTRAIWQKSFGGEYAESMKRIVALTDGCFVAVGESDSSTSETKTSPTNGWIDAWLVKFDTEGNKLWDLSIGSPFDDHVFTAQATDDGGVIVFGNYSRNGIWVFKVSSAGTKVWETVFYGRTERFAKGLPTPDGGVLIIASSKSPREGETTSMTTPSHGHFDWWLVRIDSAGQKLWDKTYGGTGYDQAFDGVTTPDGGFLITGVSSSPPSGNKTAELFGNTLTGHAEDAWVLRIDGKGEKIWERAIGGTSYDFLQTVLSADDDGFVFLGLSASDVSGNKTSPNYGETDLWAVKLDGQGELVWDVSMGGNRAEAISNISGISPSILPTTDGGFMFIGISYSGRTGNKSSTNFGDSDIWVIRVDSGGTLLWDETFGGISQDDLLLAHQTNQGEVVIVTNSYSRASGNRTAPKVQGAYDLWVVTIDEEGTKKWDISFTDTYPGRYEWDVSLLSDSADNLVFATSNSLLPFSWSGQPIDFLIRKFSPSIPTAGGVQVSRSNSPNLILQQSLRVNQPWNSASNEIDFDSKKILLIDDPSKQQFFRLVPSADTSQSSIDQELSIGTYLTWQQSEKDVVLEYSESSFGPWQPSLAVFLHENHYIAPVPAKLRNHFFHIKRINP